MCIRDRYQRRVRGRPDVNMGCGQSKSPRGRQRFSDPPEISETIKSLDADVEATRVFGCTLALASEHSGGGTPSPVKECCRWLREHGLKFPGLFRVPGQQRAVLALVRKFDMDPSTSISPGEEPQTVTSLLVYWLLHLKDAKGHPAQLHVRQDDTGRIVYNVEAQMIQLRTEIKLGRPCEFVRTMLANLEPLQREVLKEITDVLGEASRPANSTHNLMDPGKLSLCVLPHILSCAVIMICLHDEVFVDSPSAGSTQEPLGPSGPRQRRRSWQSDAATLAGINELLANNQEATRPESPKAPARPRARRRSWQANVTPIQEVMASCQPGQPVDPVPANNGTRPRSRSRERTPSPNFKRSAAGRDTTDVGLHGDSSPKVRRKSWQAEDAVPTSSTSVIQPTAMADTLDATVVFNNRPRIRRKSWQAEAAPDSRQASPSVIQPVLDTLDELDETAPITNRPRTRRKSWQAEVAP
eukprot:TRINITY_DN1150_c0_g1_i11.p1 TRINITY_DN1150_c0_g1~~TRINITY_DN1150_c0_g1_i11.p1  ORF type:complete len:470 (-),score=45.45 TRINITY_DN1150_c0_g1_i11:210-1619(-)